MNAYSTNLKENRSHINSMFPLHVYSNRMIDENRGIHTHWHEEIEFIYMDKGNALFKINMNELQVNEGDILLINSESLHSAKPMQDSIPINHHAIVFNMNILSSSIYDVCQSKYIEPILSKKLLFPELITKTEKGNKEIKREIISMVNSFNNKATAWELNIKCSLFKIITILMENNYFTLSENITSTQNNKLQLIKKVINYIDNNYMKKIYIDDLAKQLNMNTQYFCRFFKNLTGRTPIEYLNNYRIEKAAILLRKKDDKILDIAMEVGFENFSYFIKKFKEHKNCTPLQYRKFL